MIQKVVTWAKTKAEEFIARLDSLTVFEKKILLTLKAAEEPIRGADQRYRDQ